MKCEWRPRPAIAHGSLPGSGIAFTIGEARFQTEFAATASGLLEETVELCQGRLGIGGGAAEADPSVSQAGDPPQGRFRASAKPDRDRTLDRQRIEAGIRDRVPGTLEVDQRFGPQPAHQGDLFLDAFAAVMEVFVQSGVFDLIPAQPNPQAQPAAAQHVQRGGLFGDQGGLPLRQDDHPGRQPQCVRDPGQVAEQD